MLYEMIVDRIRLSADGQTYVYSNRRVLSNVAAMGGLGVVGPPTLDHGANVPRKTESDLRHFLCPLIFGCFRLPTWSQLIAVTVSRHQP